MNGWIYKLIDVLIDGWQINGWIYKLIDGWQINGWIYKLIDEWQTNGLMAKRKRIKEWMDKLMDRQAMKIIIL